MLSQRPEKVVAIGKDFFTKKAKISISGHNFIALRKFGFRVKENWMTLNFFVVLPYIWNHSTLESFSEVEEPLFSKSTLKNLNIPQKLRKMCSGHNFLALQKV